MIEALSFITPLHLAAVPIVVGLTSAVKGIVKPETSRWLPIVSIVVGIGIAALFGGGLMPIIVGGIVIGLSASGLYSGSSAVIRG